MDPSESSEEGDAVTMVRVYSGFRKKKIRFNFLQKVMLCWGFHMFGSGLEQGSHEAASQGGANTWLRVSSLMSTSQ